MMILDIWGQMLSKKEGMMRILKLPKYRDLWPGVGPRCGQGWRILHSTLSINIQASLGMQWIWFGRKLHIRYLHYNSICTGKTDTRDLSFLLWSTEILRWSQIMTLVIFNLSMGESWTWFYLFATSKLHPLRCYNFSPNHFLSSWWKDGSCFLLNHMG